MGCNPCNSNSSSLKSHVKNENPSDYEDSNRINNERNNNNFDNSNIVNKLERCYISKTFNLENQNLKDLVFIEDFIIKKQNSKENKLLLNVFNINFNEIVNIDNNLLDIIDVKIFQASNNLMKSFPSIYHFKNLKKIDLSRNKISEISDDINNLIGLQELNLSHNQIRDFPNLRNITNLKEVDLSNNKLTVLNKNLLSLNTYTLILNHNLIESIEIDDSDHGFKISDKIVNLDLSYNKLTNIPSFMLLNSSSCIALLNLKGNNISYYDLKKVDGYDQLMERRKIIKSNGFTNNLDVKFDVCGLEI